jgi:hypothetical protein
MRAYNYKEDAKPIVDYQDRLHPRLKQAVRK